MSRGVCPAGQWRLARTESLESNQQQLRPEGTMENQPFPRPFRTHLIRGNRSRDSVPGHSPALLRDRVGETRLPGRVVPRRLRMNVALPNASAICSNGAVLNQQTLNHEASFSGYRLHSGSRVNMTIFRRAEHGPPLSRVTSKASGDRARIENVSETTRSTTLGKGNIKIHTVEHVLAALAGCGMTTRSSSWTRTSRPSPTAARVSSAKIIQAAGVVTQTKKREPFTVTEPIELEMDGTLMTLFADSGLKITCTSHGRTRAVHAVLQHGNHTQNVERELSHARTFCFFEEIEFLIKNGPDPGAAWERVVIRDDAVLTTEPLRYPDEFVRHKMLDIVGDLALLGRPVHGH